MLDFKEDRIKKCIRLRFNTIIYLLIAKRRLPFIGRIIKMSKEKISASLLSAWCKGKRLVGRSCVNHFDKGCFKIIPIIICFESRLMGQYSMWLSKLDNVGNFSQEKN